MRTQPLRPWRTSRLLRIVPALAAGGAIAVLALMSSGAQATGGGKIATGCSNETVAVFGKPTTLRFVLHGVSCRQAQKLIRTYFRTATSRSCRNRGTICILDFPGGWTCSFIFAGEGPGFAGCFQLRSHRFKVYKAARPKRTPHRGFFTTAGTLHGVTATAASAAWAVGSSSNGNTLIVRWNGSAWRQVPSPSLGANAHLTAVAATSASDAWAVGSTSVEPLIVHWGGTGWAQVPSPRPGPNASLNAVAATSASDAWAVGSSGAKTLILHWDGTAWAQVPSPPGVLEAVAATSATDAWAVGITIRGHTLALHWNGTAWKRVSSPSPSAGTGLADVLDGVAATSATNAWAVGSSGCGCGPGNSLIERWNGKVWKRVHSPGPGGYSLEGVAAVSADSAWVVGATGEGDGPTKALILRWNGAAWTQLPSPFGGAYGELTGVAVTSPSNAWAVGYTAKEHSYHRSNYRTVILHWNGKAWT